MTRSLMPAVLSIVITIGFLGLLTGMMFGSLRASDSEAMLLMLGALGTSFATVVGFWFGSSRGSEDKTHLLATRKD
jgi:uncharacterized membrane protein